MDETKHTIKSEYYNGFNYNSDVRTLVRPLLEFMLEHQDKIIDIAFVIRLKNVKELDPQGNPCNIYRGISTKDEYETTTFKRMFDDMCDNILTEIGDTNEVL